jgi:hypothetical protein
VVFKWSADAQGFPLVGALARFSWNASGGDISCQVKALSGSLVRPGVLGLRHETIALQG